MEKIIDENKQGETLVLEQKEGNKERDFDYRPTRHSDRGREFSCIFNPSIICY